MFEDSFQERAEQIATQSASLRERAAQVRGKMMATVRNLDIPLQPMPRNRSSFSRSTRSSFSRSRRSSAASENKRDYTYASFRRISLPQDPLGPSSVKRRSIGEPAFPAVHKTSGNNTPAPSDVKAPDRFNSREQSYGILAKKRKESMDMTNAGPSKKSRAAADPARLYDRRNPNLEPVVIDARSDHRIANVHRPLFHPSTRARNNAGGVFGRKRPSFANMAPRLPVTAPRHPVTAPRHPVTTAHLLNYNSHHHPPKSHLHHHHPTSHHHQQHYQTAPAQPPPLIIRNPPSPPFTTAIPVIKSVVTLDDLVKRDTPNEFDYGNELPSVGLMSWNPEPSREQKRKAKKSLASLRRGKNRPQPVNPAKVAPIYNDRGAYYTKASRLNKRQDDPPTAFRFDYYDLSHSINALRPGDEMPPTSQESKKSSDNNSPRRKGSPRRPAILPQNLPYPFPERAGNTSRQLGSSPKKPERLPHLPSASPHKQKPIFTERVGNTSRQLGSSPKKPDRMPHLPIAMPHTQKPIYSERQGGYNPNALGSSPKKPERMPHLPMAMPNSQKPIFAERQGSYNKNALGSAPKKPERMPHLPIAMPHQQKNIYGEHALAPSYNPKALGSSPKKPERMPQLPIAMPHTQKNIYQEFPSYNPHALGSSPKKPERMPQLPIAMPHTQPNFHPPHPSTTSKKLGRTSHRNVERLPKLPVAQPHKQPDYHGHSPRQVWDLQPEVASTKPAGDTREPGGGRRTSPPFGDGGAGGGGLGTPATGSARGSASTSAGSSSSRQGGKDVRSECPDDGTGAPAADRATGAGADGLPGWGLGDSAASVTRPRGPSLLLDFLGDFDDWAGAKSLLDSGAGAAGTGISTPAFWGTGIPTPAFDWGVPLAPAPASGVPKRVGAGVPARTSADGADRGVPPAGGPGGPRGVPVPAPAGGSDLAHLAAEPDQGAAPRLEGRQLVAQEPGAGGLGGRAGPAAEEPGQRVARVTRE